MTYMKDHRITLNPAEDGSTDVLVHTASPEAVGKVLTANVEDEDGRSQYVWVRLPNGDLILGVFPQGDTYCEVEYDAHYRGE